MLDKDDADEVIWTRIDARFYTAHQQGLFCGSIDGQHGRSFIARNGAGYYIAELSSLEQAQTAVTALCTSRRLLSGEEGLRPLSQFAIPTDSHAQPERGAAMPPAA